MVLELRHPARNTIDTTAANPFITNVSILLGQDQLACPLTRASLFVALKLLVDWSPSEESNKQAARSPNGYFTK
jgi:hypothetical protein